jgi:hypothetical protein
MSTCEPIQGNPDFYGIGIRIGVYLQWASAWVTLLVDPKSAQSVLDTNSAFVFAVTIATIIASRRDAAHVELYIMLQILLGFPITTLSSFGIRIWLMTPGRAEKLFKIAREAWNDDRRKTGDSYGKIEESKKRAEMDFTTWLRLAKNPEIVALEPGELHVHRVLGRAMFSLISYTASLASVVAVSLTALPVNLLSALKFPELTWSGVVWRTTTLGLITVYNMMYWDEMWMSESATPANCEAPVVFLFSRQLLQGPVVQFGRVTAIIMIILVGPPVYTLIWLTLKIHYFGFLPLVREIVYSVNPHAPELVGTALSRVNRILQEGPLPVMEAFQYYSALFPTGLIAVEALKSSLDFLEFMSTKPTGDAIRFTDLLKVFVSLGMGKPSIQEAPEVGPALSRADTMLGGRKPLHRSSFWRRLSLLYNIYAMLSIAWFIILSIELTIRWNNIQGVNTIDSTGQLIPFIIGCVSASQTVKKLILLALAKVGAYVASRISKRAGADSSSAGVPRLGRCSVERGDRLQWTNCSRDCQTFGRR